MRSTTTKARLANDGASGGTPIDCPECGAEFTLSDAVEERIAARRHGRAEADQRKRERELRTQAQKIAAQTEALKRAREEMDEEVQKRLTGELKRVAAEEQHKATEALAVKMKDLERALAQKTEKLVEAEKAELEFRKQRRELEEQKRTLELEKARQLDEEREKIRADTRKALDDEFRLKDAEKDKQLADLRRQIDDWRRKADQGSQQTQGEVLELGLQASLHNCFPQDRTEPVPKGAHGGDVLQRVHDARGAFCGTIIWETKRTKAWADGWVAKLKDDQIAAKAELAALITVATPKDLDGFGCRENVWVAPPALAIALAGALRTLLIETAAARRAEEGKQEKMEILYGYLSGPEFKRRVEAIVDSFQAMREGLDQEKRAMTRIWAAREKQIDRVINNTVGMHGDLAGIIGRALPAIETLELKALGDGQNADEVA
jgi:hypothetical protein